MGIRFYASHVVGCFQPTDATMDHGGHADGPEDPCDRVADRVEHEPVVDDHPYHGAEEEDHAGDGDDAVETACGV